MIDARSVGIRHQLRELRELGLVGSAFRIAWEAKRRSRFFELTDRPPRHDAATARALEGVAREWGGKLWFANGATVRDRLSPPSSALVGALVEEATAAKRGDLRFFSHTARSCGEPIDWHRDPTTGARADAGAHWCRAVSTVSGDIKDLWEMGRFPQAYSMVRAAAFDPARKEDLAGALATQIAGFLDQNPFARGVHWASGQEIALRLFAWTFALPMLLEVASPRWLVRVARYYHDAAVHIARHIDYARYATHNNHLLAEAAALLLAAHLIPGAAAAPSFRALGRSLFDEGVRRQFYSDGGYIQQSHNYHRVALHYLLWASMTLRAGGEAVPAAWVAAGLRSVEFLRAQQAPDGSLPNYGNNDGALVCPLSFCSYDDYRPALQSTEAALRGRRLFEPGPWDEEALWFLGELPTELPAPKPQRSRSFPTTGHHVLRATPDTFALFRCGTLRDRFTQMDMLNVDVFWRGHNVVVDPGTYRYNGAPAWHAHFQRTASHNTVTVDGADQMVHVRQFKMLYPAEARVLAFEEASDHRLVAGEHLGFQRLPGRATHRRSVLSVGSDLFVVVDRVQGDGRHSVRLHWLLGTSPRTPPATLVTEDGPFELAVFDQRGERCELDVAEGREGPIRGWLSRRYAHKVPAPSLALEVTGGLPVELVTVMGASPVSGRLTSEGWSVQAGGTSVEFQVTNGIPTQVRVQLPSSGVPS